MHMKHRKRFQMKLVSQAIKDSSLRVEEIAAKSGLAMNTIRSLRDNLWPESWPGGPRTRTLDALAEALGLDTTDFYA